MVNIKEAKNKNTQKMKKATNKNAVGRAQFKGKKFNPNSKFSKKNTNFNKSEKKGAIQKVIENILDKSESKTQNVSPVGSPSIHKKTNKKRLQRFLGKKNTDNENQPTKNSEQHELKKKNKKKYNKYNTNKQNEKPNENISLESDTVAVEKKSQKKRKHSEAESSQEEGPNTKISKNNDADSGESANREHPKRIDKLTVEQIEMRINEIQSRDTITKSARRKLAFYKKCLSIKKGGKEIQLTKKVPRIVEQVIANDVIRNSTEKGNKKSKHVNTGKKNEKNLKKTLNKLDGSEKDDETDEDNSENDSSSEEIKSDSDGQDSGENENDKDGSNEEQDNIPNQSDKMQNKIKTKSIPKKHRYVLFVGALPENITAVDIKKHFLGKVEKVVNIRIPLNDEGNQKGIAFVEFDNQTDYEKGLSLHNTFLNGKKINVQYTAAGGKKSKDGPKFQKMMKKNKKLQALSRAGLLKGNKKDKSKRSFRRKINNMNEKKTV